MGGLRSWEGPRSQGDGGLRSQGRGMLWTQETEVPKVMGSTPWSHRGCGVPCGHGEESCQPEVMGNPLPSLVLGS